MRLRFAAFVLILVPAIAAAESGIDAWLRYARLDDATAQQYRNLVPNAIVSLTDGPVVGSAREELRRGIAGLLGLDVGAVTAIPATGAIVIGRRADLRRASPQFHFDGPLGADGYILRIVRAAGVRYVVVTGDTDRGVLYGSFALLRRIAAGESMAVVNVTSAPYAPVRWVNQWDNLDGSIERGYGGRSIFWENGHARADLIRVSQYGRLLASLGINGVSINNVNANPQALSAALIPDVARIADALRPWGVRVALAIDFGSPKSVGGLETYDPLDPAVIAWWKGRVDALYLAIVDFAGFVLKADSEGRVGPSTYGRSHADAANVVARALKPHGGTIFYRGFVYDHHMDWQNPKNDRARAAYDNFHPLDGQFDDNVVIQIKNGPIDFQVREPASPLFGTLERTNQAIELQITQEYMGQARHTVFLVPMWKETLDFDLRVGRPAAASASPVKSLVSGRTFRRPIGGFVGVANIGLDENWSGNHLSQANLYGFGRLAWNPDLTSQQIADEWTRQTFGNDPSVVRTVNAIQLSSWRTYENYTGPLGLQTLTDIVGNHFGVAVEASERNGWGQWHKADEQGVGFDRTAATGTGFIGQYSAPVASFYESTSTCPDNLLLFMHHVPYTHKLHNGKTVIQHLYDTHYDGVDAVDGYVHDWTSLKGKMDDARYADVLAQLDYQAGQAIVWRDAVSMWFYRASHVDDAQGRVGHYAGRLEAEEAILIGYAPKAVTPWESASGGRAVECGAATCTATFTYRGASGARDLTVRYFDVNNGAARFRLFVAGRLVGEWTGDDTSTTRRMRVDSSSSARRVWAGIEIKTGDQIRIEGTPAGMETAALDYIEIGPAEAGRSVR